MRSPVAQSLAVVAVCVAAVLSLFGQTQTPTPQFRESIDLGHVDVVALDSRRRPVRGLTAADFTLRIDGKPQPIRALAAVDVPPAQTTATTAASWTRDVAPDVQTNIVSDEGRLVAILFDRSIPAGPKLATARRIARAAVNELGPNDLAAVLPTVTGPIQDFTNDRSRLLKAIDGTGPSSVSGDSQAGQDATMVDALGPGFANVPALFKAHDACFCNVCVLEKIRDIAAELRSAPRRKVLLFIGSEITLDTLSIDPVGGVMGRFPTSDVSPHSVADECSAPIKAARTSMFRALDLANVTIHSIDPAGLQPLPDTSASSSLRATQASRQAAANRSAMNVQAGSIRVLPDRTGGRTIANTNAPETHVPAVMAESAAYYVIGFDIPPNLPPAAKVEVRTSRRGVTIHVQKLFDPPLVTASPSVATSGAAVAPSPAGSTPASLGAMKAMTSLLPARGLTLRANALPVVLSGEPAAIVVVGLELPPRGPRGTETGRFEIITGAFDARANLKAEARHAVEIGPGAAGANRDYNVVSHLVLKPGSYEIRVGVAGDDMRSGSVATYVDVPDLRKEALSLSGIALSTVPADPGAVAGRVRESLPFVPTSRRIFRPGETVRLHVQVYQGPGDPGPVQLEVRIVDAQGQDRMKTASTLGADRFSDDRASSFNIDIPLSAFAAGEYLISIGATEGKNTARRAVRLTLQ